MQSNIYKFFLISTSILLIKGCGMPNAEELAYFKNHLSKLLDGKESVEVVASDLTNFSWDSLCFNREEKLKITFRSVKKEVVFRLDYEDYFVDEGYVAASLDGQCISNTDAILIKRKYPGYSETIEFLDARK